MKWVVRRSYREGAGCRYFRRCDFILTTRMKSHSQSDVVSAVIVSLFKVECGMKCREKCMVECTVERRVKYRVKCEGSVVVTGCPLQDLVRK